MANTGQERNHDRIAGLIFVTSVHAVLGYALIIGLGIDLARSVSGALKVFDVVEEPPPPIIAQPVSAPATPDREGAAAPSHEDSGSSPLAPPPPKVRLVVSPRLVLPPSPGTGSGVAGGSGKGEGSGTGGVGTGAGGRGTATGGGLRLPAQYLKGAITGSDYPHSARRAHAEGIVYVRFLVNPEGRARDCLVTRSSGNQALDSTTCRLIERRFRYRPARDGNGQAISDIVVGNQIWWFK